MRRDRGQQALPQGQAREQRRHLEGTADPAPHDLQARQAHEIGAAEQHAPGVGADVTRNQVEERRLAGAVGADDRGQRTLGEVERNVAHRHDAAKRLGQALDLQPLPA